MWTDFHQDPVQFLKEKSYLSFQLLHFPQERFNLRRYHIFPTPYQASSPTTPWVICIKRKKTICNVEKWKEFSESKLASRQLDASIPSDSQSLSFMSLPIRQLWHFRKIWSIPRTPILCTWGCILHIICMLKLWFSINGSKISEKRTTATFSVRFLSLNI